MGKNTWLHNNKQMLNTLYTDLQQKLVSNIIYSDNIG